MRSAAHNTKIHKVKGQQHPWLDSPEKAIDEPDTSEKYFFKKNVQSYLQMEKKMINLIYKK